jgi:hypothetical protein
MPPRQDQPLALPKPGPNQAVSLGPDQLDRINAPHLVALVRAGATFHKGKLVERPSAEDGTVMVA